MRNESLTGYLLHQRPYQEKRALYYLFSQQHGVVHGVGKKGAPLFEPLQLFATGKRDLKTFSQMAITHSDVHSHNEIGIQRYQQITGERQYAALYINEVLWRLLPTEDPMPMLWQHYQNSLLQLKQPLSAAELRLCLRHFEQHLFQQLGFALSLVSDSSQTSIDPDRYYRFLVDVGFMPITDNDISAQSHIVFSGSDIIVMETEGVSTSTITLWSRLHRHLIDHLLDYQPLQSRLLWQQQQRYQ